jgi:hypothetical protein
MFMHKTLSILLEPMLFFENLSFTQQAIGGLIRLLFDLPPYILDTMLHLFNPTPLWYAYLINGGVHTANMVQHTHNLALAINRAHGLFFPFHYSMVFAKKKYLSLSSGE